jgi:hypothetical protein
MLTSDTKTTTSGSEHQTPESRIAQRWPNLEELSPPMKAFSVQSNGGDLGEGVWGMDGDKSEWSLGFWMGKLSWLKREYVLDLVTFSLLC